MQHNSTHHLIRRAFPVVFLMVIALLLGLFALAVGRTSAQSFPTATVTATAADVHAAPDLNAQKFMTLQRGEEVPLIGWRTADSAWVLVGAGQNHGWVQAHQISSDFPLANLAVGDGSDATSSRPGPSVPVGGRSTIPTAVVTSYGLNVRSGPSIAYDIVAQIRRDYVLELDGRTADMTWVQVRLQDGRTGWVNARYIRTVDGFPISSLPVTDSASPPTNAPVGGRQPVHVVQPGENLFRIALTYGVDLQTLARWNGIANPALIYAGQVLVIPS